MAFFGEDGLQRQLKQAQRDLMEKGKPSAQTLCLRINFVQTLNGRS